MQITISHFNKITQRNLVTSFATLQRLKLFYSQICLRQQDKNRQIIVNKTNWAELAKKQIKKLLILNKNQFLLCLLSDERATSGSAKMGPKNLGEKKKVLMHF